MAAVIKENRITNFQIAEIIADYAGFNGFKRAEALEILEPVITSSQTVDWTHRPLGIVRKINQVFENLTNSMESNWTLVNGADKYSIGEIDEHRVLLQIINSAPLRKNFYVLDIGAGNFQWGQATANFINRINWKGRTFTVHIIGIRGETNTGKQIANSGRCIVYRYGAFKIEEIASAFRKRCQLLDNKIDVAVQRWCCRHLVDPSGTYVQIMNLMRPKTGMFFTDGFFFLCQKDNIDSFFDSRSPHRNLISLFIHTRVSFLMKSFDKDSSLNHFILRREDNQPIYLPMHYIEMIKSTSHSIDSMSVVRFDETFPRLADREINWPNTVSFHGDLMLYSWLNRYGLLPKYSHTELRKRGNSTWMPLIKPYDNHMANS